MTPVNFTPTFCFCRDEQQSLRRFTNRIGGVDVHFDRSVISYGHLFEGSYVSTPSSAVCIGPVDWDALPLLASVAFNPYFKTFYLTIGKHWVLEVQYYKV